jgi:glucose-6-phosphate isomerase
MDAARDGLARSSGLDTAGKRARLENSLHVTAGALSARMSSLFADARRIADGLFQRKPSTWSSDPDVQKKIANRLGWLTSPSVMSREVDRLRRFADAVRTNGTKDIVLLGMGGSSLAPEVLHAVVGTTPGSPRFRMLDSTDPAAVRAAETPPQTTLYILASKSGTTIEPNALAAHFQDRLVRAGVTQWADHFVAITDDGTELARRARAESFTELFVNPSDIGGRYSALSFFGLVPAALLGQDIASLIDWGVAMLDCASGDHADVARNPAVGLGLALGAAALDGHDKLTLVLPPRFERFGLWVEQLIAESTGKEGVGIVPVTGEPLAGSDRYGDDRFFVQLAGAGATPAPAATLEVSDPLAIGAEFIRWEIATAVAGAFLKINPFDEPNVQQAKDATSEILKGYESAGSFRLPPADATLPGNVTLTLSRASRQPAEGTAEDFLTQLRKGDYFAVLAYLPPDGPAAGPLQELRMAVRDRKRVATTVGYGPRYLHSTGQLHKGGPNTGVFLLFTATPTIDVDIPGKPFSFATLELAQALGDFFSLDRAGRRALHVHLPTPDPDLIHQVGTVLLARLERGDAS